MRYLVHNLRRNLLLLIWNIQPLNHISIVIIIVAVAIEIKVVLLKAVLYALLLYSLMLRDWDVFAYALPCPDEAVCQHFLRPFLRVHSAATSLDAWAPGAEHAVLPRAHQPSVMNFCFFERQWSWSSVLIALLLAGVLWLNPTLPMTWVSSLARSAALGRFFVCFEVKVAFFAYADGAAGLFGISHLRMCLRKVYN